MYLGDALFGAHHDGTLVYLVACGCHFGGIFHDIDHWQVSIV